MPCPRNGRHPGVDLGFVPSRGNYMENRNPKVKDGATLDKDKSKGKGSEKGKTKDISKEVEKETPIVGKEGSKQEDEPIIRKPALMRTPPTKCSPSVSNRNIDSGGKSPTESAEMKSLAEGKKGESRSTVPDPFKKCGVTRSPPRKLGRTGSFSEIERKINFGNTREQPIGNDDKKRKRSDSDELEERKNSKERRSAIQLMKTKLQELKEEVENEVLKTSKMETLVEEMCILIEMAEAEEMISLEESKDGGILRRRRIVNGKIKMTNSYNQFLEVEQMEWPEECYTRTNINSGNFPTDQGDVIFLRNNADPDMTTGVAKRLMENFPEIAQLKENTWETLITLEEEVFAKRTGNGMGKADTCGNGRQGGRTLRCT